MNSRERVNTALSRQIPDRVPVDLSWGFTPPFYEKFRRITGETDYEKYFGIDTRLVLFNETQSKKDYSSYFEGRDLTGELTIIEWGIGYLKGQDQSLHFERIVSPLKFAESVNDIVDYPFPDYMEKYRWEDLKKRVENIQNNGLAACASLATTLFETAWQIRGFEEFIMDMAAEPEMAECLLDRLMHLRIDMAVKFAQAGVDVLMLGDDIAMQTGMMISPDLWRKWFKPRMSQIIATAKNIKPDIHVFYHSDGNPGEIIDELIEIGINVLNPVQPECIDPAVVKRKYGDRLAFWGTIGVQSTLPFGTPDDVKREVKLRMETVGRNGGLLIGPAHMIEPEVPWENLVAFMEAVEEYGYYN